MEKLRTILTFLSKYKNILLITLLVIVVAIIFFQVGKGYSIKTNIEKIDGITAKQEQIFLKIDSTNKSLAQIKSEQRYIRSTIDKTLKNISKIENERIKKINTINTNSIDGTLVILSNRYKVSKDTISK